MKVIDLSTLSLVGGSGIAESKIPLWFSDGTSVSTNSSTNTNAFINDGSSSMSSTVTSSSKIFTLSSNWSPNTKFAFEVTMWSQIGSGVIVYAELYDTNTSSTITSISSQVTSATVLRSGQCNLTPGHSYGVWFETSGGPSYYLYVSDISLVVFP